MQDTFKDANGLLLRLNLYFYYYFFFHSLLYWSITFKPPSYPNLLDIFGIVI